MPIVANVDAEPKRDRAGGIEGAGAAVAPGGWEAV